MEKILELKPCYSREEIEKLFAGRKWISPRTIARLDIPLDDRLWVLTGLMSGKQQREFSRRCALDVIHLWEAPDIVKKYLKTGDEDIREAANKIDWYDAIAAAMYEFKAAARDAAALATTTDETWASARAAARATASHVSGNMPDVASWNFAWTDAMEKYIGWCVEYLDGTKEITCE
jgi:hypothetical protein